MRNFKSFRQHPFLLLAASFIGIATMPLVRAEALSSLTARGNTVLPVPQKVILGSQDFTLTDGWQLVLEGGIGANEVAVESLREQLAERFHLTLVESGVVRSRGGVIRLAIVPGSLVIGEATDRDNPGLAEQA
jgi:hypothetical protein